MIPELVDDGSDDPLAPVVEADDWIAYHGTSSAYSEGIETEGLDSRVRSWGAADCHAVLDFAEELQWYGISTAISNLKVFGLQHDLAKSGKRHIYMAEFFARAQLFAQLPGGEGAQAILLAIEELAQFVGNAEIRANHADYLTADMRKMGYDLDDAEALLREAHEQRRSALRGYLRAMELAVDPDALEARLAALRSIEARLRAVTQNHQPVVYAVRLDSRLLEGARYDPGMGIEVVQPVPPRQLLGKVVPVYPLAESLTAIRFPHITFDHLPLIERWSSRIGPAMA
jgi:hypothetical protein